MCGLAGLMGSGIGDGGKLTAVAAGMALTIQHRGPDDAGAWADAEAGIALGHRRLSVIDLSSAGHQPMHSASGRFVLAYNGEVYNHLDIRAELEAACMAPAWRGHSDTETLLAAFEHWGVEATLARTVGMFAIALWDASLRTLYLARDRFGEKPLYYGWVGSGGAAAFVFGSEMKALRAYPGFANKVSRDALALYMRFACVPAPYSIYEDIYKLEPGCLVSVCEVAPPAPNQPLRPGSSHGMLNLRRWWSLEAVVEAGARNRISDDDEAVQALEEKLGDSVRIQSLADVPLGAFLSGGVDSSAIVALMQAQSVRPVQTFTVGFDEVGFDESPHALAVAQHLGTEHHALRVTAADARAVIPQLPVMYDEPFADSSQIPTHLVCKAAQLGVTVALSGDGGDELFGGYNRYLWGPLVWNRMKWIPRAVRRGVAAGSTRVPMAAWDALGHALPGNHGVALLGDKILKLAKLTEATNLSGLYRSLVTEWPQDADIVRGAKRLPIPLDDASLVTGVPESEQRMMIWDTLTYLPDDILTKVDRAAMSVSLETRVPFLDHRVVELAWRLPLDMKIRNGQSKWALRQVLYKYVPRKLIDRPKAGFAIPLGEWLRGPLRDWAESLLNESRLRSEGYFHPAPIRAKWTEHLSNRHDHTASLWTVLMFQAWLEATH